MFTNFINSFRNTLSEFNPEDLTGVRLNKILWWLGIAFIIGFILPYYDWKFHLQLAPKFSSNHEPIAVLTALLYFYLPVVYGIVLILAGRFKQQNSFNIILLCLSFLLLLILPRELHKTELAFFQITSINLFGTFGLMVLSNCLLFIGISHTDKVLKLTSSRNLTIAGALLFLMNLLIPFQLYCKDFDVSYLYDRMLLLAPVDLIGDRNILTGIVLAVYLILMVVLIIRVLFFTKIEGVKNKGINMLLFTATWFILICGMLFAGNIDIMLNGARFSVYPWRENVRECLYYIKSILYILPLIGLIFISVYKLLTDNITKKRE